MRYYLLMFGLSLGMTLVLELAVAFCFGLRSKDALLIVILVNFLTNPAAVWLHTVVGLPQIPIEILIVITECYVYRSFQIKCPLPLSLSANGVSWGLGLILQML